MRRRKKNREINVFSASAIDLFASSLGVFIVLVIILFPYFNKKSEIDPSELTRRDIEIETLSEEVRAARLIENRLSNQITSLKNQIQQTLIDQETKNDDLAESFSVQEQNRRKIVSLQNKVFNLENQKAELEQQLKNIPPPPKNSEKIVDQLQSQVQELRQKLSHAQEKLSSDNSAGSFAAILIKWETNKHDVDLIVKDPQGRVFDFKRRKHKNHPGEFTLDSRSGPGAEVWQSDKIIPGKYTVTYRFYNDYGNKSPAQVNGTIITKKGSFKIKNTKLDFSKRPQADVNFKINKEGDVLF